MNTRGPYSKYRTEFRTIGIVLVLCLILVSVHSIHAQLSGSTVNTGIVSSHESFLDTSFESGDPGSEVICETSPPPSYPQDEYVHGEIEGSQEQAQTGLWSAKLYSVNGGPAGRCRLNWVVEPTKQLYVRAYFYVETWDGYIQVMRFWSDHPEDQQESGAGNYVARLSINHDYIRVQLGKHSPAPRPYEKRVNTNFETGKWYCFEMMLYIHPSDGEFRVWVDDAEITALAFRGDTYTDWSHWITETKVGVVLYQQNVDPAVVFVDDYAVDEAKIGSLIPEFPSFIILPLFMIATLLAGLAYRRKS